MPIKSGFFNSVNGDRRYDARWFAEYFASFIGNGVFPNPSTNLQVVEGTGMQTIVKIGKGWINGYYVVNDSDYILQHDIADGVLKRIDRIVMRLNYPTREIEIAIKKGEYSSNPVAPTLQRDADAYELALADVLINNGATTITQANITDLRLNTDLCGIVHGTVDQVDTTTLYNQYLSWFNQFTQNESTDFEQWRALEQTEFDNWFQSVKDILNTNVAMDLQNQINAHIEDYVKHPAIATTTNDGNNYFVTLDPPINEYVEGMGLILTINADSTDDVTVNVDNNGPIFVLKANGTNVKLFNAGGVYSLRYSNGNFYLLGEGGGGNATDNDLLEGKTAVSDSGDLIGAMPNRGAMIITPKQTNQIIPKGYHDGNGFVEAVDFEASKVLTGTIIAGKSGTMPNRGAGGTVTPGTTNQTKAAGYYSSAITILGDADLIPSNIRSGKNLFGVNGTLNPKEIAAGNTFNLYSAPEGFEISNRTTTYVKLTPNFTFLVGGTIRISFTASYTRALLGGLPQNSYYVVYKNGIAVGTVRTVTDSNDETVWTQDFSVSANDIFSIYGRAEDPTTDTFTFTCHITSLYFKTGINPNYLTVG
ncbi:hypothetical protein MTP04_24320 [Lysinibacillus sp. PLM2]|nr:hypothetical protein MTP04_24320 [Lysinibacillus sp. PLM2]